MNIDHFNYPKYIRIYFITLIILAIPFLMNYIFLKNCEEFLSIEEIYERQNTSKGEKILYGSAIFNNSSELKLYPLEKKKPHIIAFGSSRVLEFREAFFSQSFYNMGQMASSVHEALYNIPRILEKHVPEVILIGVDFWWFNDEFLIPQYNKGFQTTKNVIDPAHFLLPFKWVKDDKINLTEYFMTLQSPKKSHIGVIGKINQSGVASDGSYYYINLITGKDPYFKDVTFSNTLAAIRQGTGRFKWGDEASDVHFKKFIKLINDLGKKGIKVILFLPPLSSVVNNEMKKFNYAYITDLKRRFSDNNIMLYDFAWPQKIGSNDCEFVDGFHGGDVTYAKLLKKIALKEPVLNHFIDNQYLENIISRYSGLAMIPVANAKDHKEVDFLGLGCTKS